jgi:hypothetical protein
MITRAYQNAKGERQEVAMNAAEWDVLTEDQLQDMLGFKAEAPPAPTLIPSRAPAPFVRRKGKGK